MFDAGELRKQLKSAGCPDEVANTIIESVAEMNARVSDTTDARTTLGAVKFANEMVNKVVEKNIPEPIAEEFMAVYSRINGLSDNLVSLGESMKEGIRLVTEMGDLLNKQIDRIDQLEKLANEFIETQENGYFD